MSLIELACGDCLDVLNGVRGKHEAVVMDPPSAIRFMNLLFDTDHGSPEKWVEYFAMRFAACREACIPGAYGLFWALPRTQDLTMQALRRAGWNIVDVIQHVQGQGWPKGKGQMKPSQEAWILCRDPRGKVRPLNIDACRVKRGSPIAAHRTYQGKFTEPYRSGDAGKILQSNGSWPTNIAFSHCPACKEVGTRMERGNIMADSGGTGSIGYGGSAGLPRGVGRSRCFADPIDGTETVPAWECLAACACGLASLSSVGGAPDRCPGCDEERWWCCPVAELDGQSGTIKSGYSSGFVGEVVQGATYGVRRIMIDPATVYADSGGASRFFPTFHYDAKASTHERQAGCEELLWIKDKDAPIGWKLVDREVWELSEEDDRKIGNVHATIKPIGCGVEDGLMRWLVRLVTPEMGSVLDGTMGSGSTGVAAQIEGRDFFGCDIDCGAVEIAKARTSYWTLEKHNNNLIPKKRLKKNIT